MADSGIDLRGFDEFHRALENPALLGRPLKKFFTRSTVVIQNRGRQNAPVDIGQLQQAIDHEIDKAAVPGWAKVGVIKADFSTPLGKKAFSMEYGTGLFAEGRNAKGKRYFPPPASLDRWAKRHGFQSGRQVAFIIWRRGGLKPRRYLRTAFEDSLGDIKGFIRRLGGDIKDQWEALTR